MTTTTLGAAGIALAALLAAETATAADLEVSIEGLRSDQGHARVALHRRSPGVDFPGNAVAVASISRPAEAGGIRIVFTGLAPGDYAVAAFHDADGDGELGRNILSLPTEGYGFSNGARGFMGPPGFDAAAVTVGADDSPLFVVVPIDYPGS